MSLPSSKKPRCACQCTLTTSEWWDGEKAELQCGQGFERTLLFADPTPTVDQVCWGCTQRAATVDEESVNAKTDLFQRVTTSKVDGPHLRGLSHTTVSACSHDMRGHAEHCVERYCELAKKKNSVTTETGGNALHRCYELKEGF